MQNPKQLIALSVIMAVIGGGTALAQPAGPGGGFMHGPGPGGMGPGMMGRVGGPWFNTDAASYLDRLKADLGITAAQEPAWNSYAETVRGVAEQMQGVHQTMYEAMGTATWQERRDMMNGMFQSRQQAFDTVHEAAEKLLPALTAEQRAKAAGVLPGLTGRGRGMMGHWTR